MSPIQRLRPDPTRAAGRAVLLAAAALAAPAVSAGTAAAASPTTGRLLVTVERDSRGHGTAAVTALAGRAGARRAGRSIARLGLITLAPAPGTSLRALRARLLGRPGVARVEVERRASPRLDPGDPALTTQETAPGTPAGTPVEWWAARAALLDAWDVTTGAGARVAVIDAGVDASHPDLAGHVLAAADFSGQGPPTEDPIGHGTHVASLACAAGGNGIGLAGAGLRCGLLVARTDYSDSSVAAAILWAVSEHADAIIMSFGTDPGTVAPTPLRRALATAYASGALLAAAAADRPVGDQGYPANVLQPDGTAPQLDAGLGLSVTAATAADARASFAGRGSQISIAGYGAWGEDGQGGPPGIFGAFTSTAPSELELGAPAFPPRKPCGCRTVFGGDPRYAYLQGTSMATPMVGAVGALAHHLNPDLGPGEVARLLKRTARRPPGIAGWTPDLGWGVLDAGSTLRAAAQTDRRPPTSRAWGPAGTTHATSVTLRWSGRDRGPAGVRISGIARFELWRATNGGPWRRVLATTRRSGRVRLRAGSRYGFASVAVDRAGNVEPLPAVPDVRLTALGR